MLVWKISEGKTSEGSNPSPTTMNNINNMERKEDKFKKMMDYHLLRKKISDNNLHNKKKGVNLSKNNKK